MLKIYGLQISNDLATPLVLTIHNTKGAAAQWQNPRCLASGRTGVQPMALRLQRLKQILITEIQISQCWLAGSMA